VSGYQKVRDWQLGNLLRLDLNEDTVNSMYIDNNDHAGNNMGTTKQSDVLNTPILQSEFSNSDRHVIDENKYMK
jgi:hypothetical protein